MTKVSGMARDGREADVESVLGADDPLMVRSVEKAFRVLSAFDETRASLTLTQLAAAIDLDRSATQRLSHTLVKLGYLQKNPDTKQFELSVKMLNFAYQFTRANRLVDKALPYLLHLSKATEETVNLTVLDDVEIVFISRFMSRHVLNNDVVIGTRMPAYCTAPGIAILSRLPTDEARVIVDRSDRKQFTIHTTHEIDDVMRKIATSAERGYSTAFEEYFYGDISIAAAVTNAAGRPTAAINVAVSRTRFSPEEAVDRFSGLVVAAAASVSQTAGARR